MCFSLIYVYDPSYGNRDAGTKSEHVMSRSGVAQSV